MPESIDVEVNIRGAAEAILATESVKLSLESLTPREIVKAIADQNPLIKQQLIRDNGDPRLSTKILVDGTPPKSLDDILSAGSKFVVAPAIPCDG